jgi:hypothetical protein
MMIAPALVNPATQHARHAQLLILVPAQDAMKDSFSLRLLALQDVLTESTLTVENAQHVNLVAQFAPVLALVPNA